ncbi:hypothetical protein ACU5DF_04340 [Aliivibrio wodanis]|uniref:hypothetical protein n=1 Tax=Aliivibrio wodanis TaxID=80852 RepID=UPI00406C0AD1
MYQKIEWEPMCSARKLLNMHILEKIDGHFEIKKNIYFFSLFVTSLLVAQVFILYGFADMAISAEPNPIIPFSVALIFLCMSALIVYLDNNVFFNRDSHVFYKSKKRHLLDFKNKYEVIGDFSDILILQLLSKKEEGVAYSYELNAVLNNGERFHIIELSNLEQAINQLNELSDFLNIPTVKHY